MSAMIFVISYIQFCLLLLFVICNKLVYLIVTHAFVSSEEVREVGRNT